MSNTPGAYCNIASLSTVVAGGSGSGRSGAGSGTGSGGGLSDSTRRLYWPPELRQQQQQQEQRRQRSSADTCDSIVDHSNAVYVAMILCGIGFLLPYNTFVTAVDFYQARYPDSTIVFDISLVYICVALGSVFLNNILVELLSLDTRIIFGYVSSFLVLVYVAVFELSSCVNCTDGTYHLTLLSVAVVSFGCTVQQSSFYGFTSMLPRRYTQAVMTGESAAGLIVSLNRIFTKAIINDMHKSTLIFFIVGIACIVSCCAVYCLARRTRFVRFHVTQCQNAVNQLKQENGRIHKGGQELGMVSVGADNQYGKLCIQDEEDDDDHHTSTRTTSPTADQYNSSCNYGLINDTYEDCESSVSVIGRHQLLSDQHSSYGHNQGGNACFRKLRNTWINIKHGYWRRYDVARIAWPYMASISITYFITLCLFPGIESEIVSCRLGSWMPVLLIAIFNFFDLVGKLMASFHYDWPTRRLVAYSSLRVLLVPAMMLCALPREQPVLQRDGFAMTCSLLLGLSNGYFGSVPMILAPGKVPSAHKELTGNIMTISYSIGLTSGSIVAYLLDLMLGARLPSYIECPGIDTSTSSLVQYAQLNSTF